MIMYNAHQAPLLVDLPVLSVRGSLLLVEEPAMSRQLQLQLPLWRWRRRLLLLLQLLLLVSAVGGDTGGGDAQLSDEEAAAHGNMARLLDGYDDGMYKTMRDDAPRTAAYTEAIQRLAPGKVVLDIGTGQFALLASIAAKAGARYVYAIEGNRQAFERAKLAVAEQNLTDRVGVLFGYSANVSLQELPPPPSSVDEAGADAKAGSAEWPGVQLVIHELLGEIAGMEGAAYAIADAHRRHIAPPAAQHAGAEAPRVSVPYGARTFIAPTAFPPPEYWSKLPVPVIMTPGTTFLKLWEFPTQSLLSEWQEFETLEFDRPETLTIVSTKILTFLVGASDGHRSNGDDERGDDGGEEPEPESDGLPFAGFVCYMDVDLVAQGAREIDTLRDKTHWAQQMLLFESTTVFPGDVITLEATVDNTQGPFTVYTFDASVDGSSDGTSTSKRRSLGRVVLDEHF